MGSWLTHLRIAEYLLEATRLLETEPFLVGSVAPDLSVPTPDGGSSPPRTVTHWLADGWAAAAETFRRECMEPRLEEADPGEASFLAGYHAHLAADALWDKAWCAARGEDVWQDEAFTQALKAEQFLLDRIYLIGHPHSIFFRCFAYIDRFPHTLPYFAPGQIGQRVRFIVDFYTKPHGVFLTHPLLHLREPELEAYIRDATAAAHEAIEASQGLSSALRRKPG